MKIAFIGDNETVLQNMLSFGIAESLFYDEKVLLFDLQFRHTKLEDAFRKEKNLFLKEESYYEIKEGLDYLLYRSNQGILTNEIIREGVTFYGEKIAIVKSALRGDFNEYNIDINNNIEFMLEQFQKEFSIILVKSDMKFFRKNSGCFDTYIKNILHDNIYKNSVYRNRDILKDDVFTIIGQVFGDYKKEKDYINDNYRTNSENLALIPYNLRVDMNFETGKILDAFNKNTMKISDTEFIDAVNNVVFLFSQWFERNK